jgi:hypothetical protein
METGRPDRVVGVHFFNPAPAMGLVEIVRPLTASDETVAEVRAFAEACGKKPVEVKDRAGFIVNALLFPYLNNAVRMLENGTASAEDIDAAMQGGCNFPMGPLALLDLVGLDTSGRHPRRPLRRVPGPELRHRPAPAPHGHRRPAGAEVRPGLLRLRQALTCRVGRSSRPRPSGPSPPAPTSCPRGRTSSPSAPTWRRAPCSPPTGAACSPCPSGRVGGRSWPGGAPSRAASCPSTACGSAGRCAGRAAATRSGWTPTSRR